MSAGLPGFGLGGVFYMLLIMWMVLLAFGRPGKTGEARSSRWAFIGKMVAIAIIMVGALIGQGVLIHVAFKTVAAFIPEMGNSAERVPSGPFLLLIATIPLVLLTLLMAGVHILRLSLVLRLSLAPATRKPMANGLSRAEPNPGLVAAPHEARQT